MDGVKVRNREVDLILYKDKFTQIADAVTKLNRQEFLETKMAYKHTTV